MKKSNSSKDFLVWPIVSKRCWFCHAAFVILVVFVSAGGCSDGRPARVPVAGSVKIDGKPLEHGFISFVPSDGQRPGGGAIEAGGQYRVSMYTAFDGLPVGQYTVVVTATEPVNDFAQRWHAPKKYANASTSELSVEITKEKSPFDIELTWKGENKSAPFIERF